LPEELVGKEAVFLPFVSVGADFALDKGPDHQPELLMFLVKGCEHPPIVSPERA
jgi:hypothetical protein